jgi:aspartate kinase
MGMKDRPGTLARAAGALSRAGVNISLASQTPAQTSMLFGVKGHQADDAIRALYGEFFS